MKKLFVLVLLVSLAGITTQGASLRLPKIPGDHMVLQQKSFCKFWGWTEPLRRAETAEEEIPNSSIPDIGLFTVEKHIGPRPNEDVNGSWELCKPETSADFSAVAYFSGKMLQQEMNVPVGLVNR